MKFFSKQGNRGMTAIELVIVLGVFSIIASITLFNYKQFQSKINIRTLSNDIALLVVEAQKSAISGKWRQGAATSWAPAYGVAFNTSFPTRFAYFVDLDNSGTCNSTTNCNNFTVGGEVLSVSNITGGSTIASIIPAGGSGCPGSLSTFAVVYRRPNTAPLPMHACNPSEVSINLSNSQSATGRIRIYASGRISMN